MTVTFADARAVEPEVLAAFHREVLRPSFRPDELVPPDGFADAFLLPDGGGHGVLALDEDGRVLAGLVVGWYEDCRVALVSYLAVRQGYRRQGLGQRLVAAAPRVLGRRLDPALVLGEVEDPRVWTDGEYGDTRARLRLYARLGARVLDVPWFQPSLGPGHERVRGLLLLVFAAREPLPPAALSAGQAEALRCFLDGYLGRGEGGIADDEEVRALRDAVAPGRTVPLLPPERVLGAGVARVGDRDRRARSAASERERGEA